MRPKAVEKWKKEVETMEKQHIDRTRQARWDRQHTRVIAAKVGRDLGSQFHALCKKEHTTAHRAIGCYIALCVDRGHIYIPSAAEHAADRRRSPRSRIIRTYDF
jgi:hypothetical protein